MRIILVHNYYGSSAPSGENQVFEDERRLLQSRGHDVLEFTRHSDEIRRYGFAGAVKGAFVTPWNFATGKQLRRTVQAFRPEVVHFHNTFPLLSPSVFPAARGAARVLTLHNYRLLCPAAMPMRDGAVCTQCLDQRSVIPALRYGCYRGSRVATIPLAANVALNRWRGTWHRDVEAFIALTEFQRNRMGAAGLPMERLWVKPNYFPGKPEVVPWDSRPRRIAFVGRLSIEKGVTTLIDAWIRWGTEAPELVLAGDGPLGEALRKRAAGAANIRFLGHVSAQQAQQLIGECQLLLLPSLWFEGFPMVLREAFAFGTPTLVSDRGPLPALVQNSGDAFAAGDVDSLLHRLRMLWGDHDKLRTMSASARQCFELNYTEEENYKTLMRIYGRAIGNTIHENCPQ